MCDILDHLTVTLFSFSSLAEACQDPYALAGMDTIFVLDTSESMRGEGISQAKGAVERLMSGQIPNLGQDP